jgi:hypothetical protein
MELTPLDITPISSLGPRHRKKEKRKEKKGQTKEEKSHNLEMHGRAPESRKPQIPILRHDIPSLPQNRLEREYRHTYIILQTSFYAFF